MERGVEGRVTRAKKEKRGANENERKKFKRNTLKFGDRAPEETIEPPSVHVGRFRKAITPIHNYSDDEYFIAGTPEYNTRFHMETYNKSMTMTNMRSKDIEKIRKYNESTDEDEEDVPDIVPHKNERPADSQELFKPMEAILPNSKRANKTNDNVEFASFDRLRNPFVHKSEESLKHPQSYLKNHDINLQNDNMQNNAPTNLPVRIDSITNNNESEDVFIFNEVDLNVRQNIKKKTATKRKQTGGKNKTNANKVNTRNSAKNKLLEVTYVEKLEKSIQFPSQLQSENKQENTTKVEDQLVNENIEQVATDRDNSDKPEGMNTDVGNFILSSNDITNALNRVQQNFYDELLQEFEIINCTTKNIINKIKLMKMKETIARQILEEILKK